MHNLECIMHNWFRAVGLLSFCLKILLCLCINITRKLRSAQLAVVEADAPLDAVGAVEVQAVDAVRRVAAVDLLEVELLTVEESADHLHAVPLPGGQSADRRDFVVGSELSDGCLEAVEGRLRYHGVWRPWASISGVAPGKVADLRE